MIFEVDNIFKNTKVSGTQHGRCFKLIIFNNTIVKFFQIQYPYYRKYTNNIYSAINHFSINYKAKQPIFESLDNHFNEINNLDFNINISGINIKKSDYSDFIVDHYFKYRMDEFGVLDYGICARYLLYDRFVKEYISNYYEALDNKRNTNHTQESILFSSFEYGFREFSIEQFVLFAYISDCIVSHNIFIPNETSLLI